MIWFGWVLWHIKYCRWTLHPLGQSTIVGYLMLNPFYTYCHVVSHWDDRNKITTILVFELTVASRQRMTVKKECGSQWRPTDVCTWWPHSGRLTREGRREKPNDWLGPQNGSGDSFSSAEIDNKKISCWTELVGNRWGAAKAKAPGKWKTKKISDKKKPYLQASTKNNITSVSLLKEERFSTGIHRNKISKLWDCFSLYPILYTLSLSPSQVEEKLKTKEKKRRKTFVFPHYSFIIYLIRWRCISVCSKKDWYILIFPCGRSCYL